jgi:hypothetical protein
MRLGDIAELGEGRDVAVHGIDRLESDDLGPLRRDFGQPAVQVLGVVVAEYLLVGPAVTDALDHRGVVHLVRQHHAARQLGRECRQRGQIRDVARGEQQRRFLAVQLGQFALQQHVVMVGARDVAGAPGAGAAVVERGVHGIQHQGALAHAQIVVGAPDRDLLDTVRAVALGLREASGAPFQIGEHAVAPLGLQARDGLREIAFVVHAPEPFTKRQRNGRVIELSFNPTLVNPCLNGQPISWLAPLESGGRR